MLRLQIVKEVSNLHSKNAGVWFLVDKMNQQEIHIHSLVLMSFFVHAPVNLERLLKI